MRKRKRSEDNHEPKREEAESENKNKHRFDGEKRTVGTLHLDEKQRVAAARWNSFRFFFFIDLDPDFGFVRSFSSHLWSSSSFRAHAFGDALETSTQSTQQKPDSLFSCRLNDVTTNGAAPPASLPSVWWCVEMISARFLFFLFYFWFFFQPAKIETVVRPHEIYRNHYYAVISWQSSNSPVENGYRHRSSPMPIAAANGHMREWIVFVRWDFAERKKKKRAKTKGERKNVENELRFHRWLGAAEQVVLSSSQHFQCKLSLDVFSCLSTFSAVLCRAKRNRRSRWDFNRCATVNFQSICNVNGKKSLIEGWRDGFE